MRLLFTHSQLANLIIRVLRLSRMRSFPMGAMPEEGSPVSAADWNWEADEQAVQTSDRAPRVALIPGPFDLTPCWFMGWFDESSRDDTNNCCPCRQWGIQTHKQGIISFFSFFCTIHIWKAKLSLWFVGRMFVPSNLSPMRGFAGGSSALHL